MYESVSLAFSRQSEIFDQYEDGNEILKWMRSTTREHILRHLKLGDNILELNSGTGLDALFLAEMGFKIHCIDIADGMINKLTHKILENNHGKNISYQLLSFTDLNNLNCKPFDFIFSNFGGLNCAEDLSIVFKQFQNILRTGGRVTLVIIPPVCPWEIALILKGKFKIALRRLHKKGIAANVEGVSFPTYYFSPKDVIKALGSDFKLVELQGLASISPPPYMKNFPNKFPKFYKILTGIDKRISHLFPFNRFADHFILTAEYNPK